MVWYRFLSLFLGACVALYAAALPASEAENTLLFGQTAALGGPASALGQGMNLGLNAAFAEANQAGGVRGKQLKLTAYDDGYEPEKAIENTKKLIHEDNVFALIGGVGTPTANATEPITSAAKVPFIGPFTGAEFLRNPFKRYVLNIRGSYWQETEEWIERLTTDLGMTRIAILYQDDSYGRAGLSGVQRAMAKRGLTLVSEATYKRNTTAVKVAALKLRKSGAEAVVIVGAYKPSAAFIKLARQLKFDPLFINISFVGSKALAAELGEAGEGVIVSQVVPYPFNSKPEGLIARYQQALKTYQPDAEFGFVSLEGYLVGRFVVEVLQAMETPITREAFLDQVYTMAEVKLDDVVLHFGPSDNQGMDQVFLTTLQKNGQFLPTTNLTQQ